MYAGNAGTCLDAVVYRNTHTCSPTQTLKGQSGEFEPSVRIVMYLQHYKKHMWLVCAAALSWVVSLGVFSRSMQCSS